MLKDLRLCALALCTLAGATLARATEFTAIDLGTLGGTTSYAVGVNDSGHVIGDSTTAAGDWRAFLWRDGTMIDLGHLGGYDSSAVAINSRDQVLGFGTTFVGAVGYHAFVWDKGEMIDVGTLGGSWSYGWGINDMGHVVGTSQTSSGERHAFLWRDGMMIDLGALVGQYSAAYSINEEGQVTITGGGAFVWAEGKLTAIDALDYSMAAWWINGAGQVTGQYETASGARAFIWQSGFKTKDLGDLGGGATIPAAINDAGQVVGIGRDATGKWRTFVWHDEKISDLGSYSMKLSTTKGLDPPPFRLALNDAGQVALPMDTPQGVRASLWENGEFTDLGTLGGGQSFPAGINDASEIAVVGGSETASGAWHATLWTTFERPTLQGEIDVIANVIEEMAAAGTLAAGEGAALEASLQAAMVQSEKGNTRAACNVLTAFVNKVTAQVRSGRLSSALGEKLIEAAQGISACQ